MTKTAALLMCAMLSAMAVALSEASLRRPQIDPVTHSPEAYEAKNRKPAALVEHRHLSSDTTFEPAEGEDGYFVHIGCFADKSDDRVLGMKFEQDDMTAELCHIYCNVRGAFYMATQNGDECFCSRAEDLDYSRHSTGVCDQPCAGDESERCGGYYSFDLYELVWPEASTDSEYIECYSDSSEDRVMSDQYISDDMTSTVCREHCEGKGALYYATQFGNECWCGLSDVFADYMKHGLGTCHMRCAGDYSEACGGHYAFSLFRFNDDSLVSTPSPEATPEPTPESNVVPEATPEPTLQLNLEPTPNLTPEPTPNPTPEPTSETSSDSPEDLEGNNDYGVFPYDGTTFTGDGTYYDGDATSGNCAIRSPIPSMYDGMIPVALNNDQYGDSEMCGACIEGEGSGSGAGNDPITGSFKAYVVDKCPECAHGDLDFAESGDGRWEISWWFVPCSGGSDEPTFIFEGSHEYYWKIQPRGTKTPVEELKVAGITGTKTDDNFFEIMDAPYPLTGSQKVETQTFLGAIASQEITL